MQLEAMPFWLNLTIHYATLRDDLTAEQMDGCIHDTTEVVGHTHWQRDTFWPVGSAPAPGAFEVLEEGGYQADIVGSLYREVDANMGRVMLPVAVTLELQVHEAERDMLDERLPEFGWRPVPCRHQDDEAAG